MKYEFDKDKLVENIVKRKAKHVLIQLPEGMKKEALSFVDIIEKANVKVSVSGSGAWGGCDLAVDEARKINADLIVHFGHAPFVNAKFPVIYVELDAKMKIVPIIEKNLDKIKVKRLGLVSSVQFIKQIEEIKDFLMSKNKDVVIPGKKGFAHYDGHVVGCEYNSLKDINVEGYLVIGNRFHALGAALMVDKPVYLLDEHKEDIFLMDKERDKIIKQRAQAIHKIKNAEKIGILVDMKLGQYNLKIAELLKKDLVKLGKEVVIISSREITPNGLMSFYDLDGFINTACPRIGIDDYTKYEKPIINSREANVIIGRKSWESLLKEGLVGFF